MIDCVESNVRYYCRTFPSVFKAASGAVLIAEDSRRFIDFFSGAGVLNYGHNHAALKAALLDHLSNDGVVHALDMDTTVKLDFLRKFQTQILAPRGLNYRVQFSGPTGANAVEAALKLARKVTGRQPILAFTGAFHGVSLGALSVTANADKRAAAGVSLDNVIRMPFEGFLGSTLENLEFLNKMLTTKGCGLELPAAIILETIQCEGGLNVASPLWLQGVANLAKRIGALLVVDEIQTGCGRTGPFFSFERAGITPDIVCLSKSLSGFGLPLSAVLIKPEFDQWAPAEHNGTFRANNLALLSGSVALDFWSDPKFLARLSENVALLWSLLAEMLPQCGLTISDVRGVGMLCGISMESTELAHAVQRSAFERGLLVETCGPRDQVVKLMPPLNIAPDILREGVSILIECINSNVVAPRYDVENQLISLS